MTFWGTVFLAAFLASMVELVEALTIVLAVGVVRGWRPALTGAAVAIALLALSVLAFGSKLVALESPVFKLVVGILLLMFGLRWLRKAILRSAGVIALHDEAQAFAKETAAMEQMPRRAGFDYGAALAAFNGVLIEGIEVLVIVLGFGSGDKQKLLLASLGAGSAAIVVLILGVVAHAPLTKIPENALKTVVGVLISAFGTYWVGEYFFGKWPGSDFALIFLSLCYLAVALVGVPLARRTARVGQAA